MFKTVKIFNLGVYMKLYDFLNSFHPNKLDKKQIAKIINKFYNLAFAENNKIADKIKAIDFSAYNLLINESFQAAIKLAATSSYKGIYYEYDIDNDWQTSCFLCPSYNPFTSASNQDDDWACDFTEHFYCGDFRALTELYEESLENQRFGSYTHLYLIIRVANAFIEALGSDLNKTKAAVCIAFHDQSIITRLKELTL